MIDNNQTPYRLYDDLVWLWPLWGSPEEYADYCDYVVELIQKYARKPVHTLLDITCGGGKNVFHLKRHYRVTGIDLNPRMIALAEKLNPECEFIEGDMRTFSLGRTFDAVLINDGITHITNRTDLASTFKAAFQHLNPGGVMVVTPDDTVESFQQNRTTVTPATGREIPDNMEVIFIENAYDADPDDDRYEGTIIYLIRESGKLRVEIDRHINGLFSLDVWRETLQSVGFEIHEHEYLEDGNEYCTFACVKAI